MTTRRCPLAAAAAYPRGDRRGATARSGVSVDEHIIGSASRSWSPALTRCLRRNDAVGGQWNASCPRDGRRRSGRSRRRCGLQFQRDDGTNGAIPDGGRVSRRQEIARHPTARDPRNSCDVFSWPRSLLDHRHFSRQSPVLASGDASLYSPEHDTVRCLAHKAHDQKLLDRVRILRGQSGAIERGSVREHVVDPAKKRSAAPSEGVQQLIDVRCFYLA
jgi:hypothetical protein